MPTLAELLQEIEGGQRSEFGERAMQITKVGAEDIRSLREAEIALQKEEEARKREIGQAGRRGTGSRYFTKFIDWITGTPVGSMLSEPLQEATKTRRFTLSSPFGERVKDPYRELETEAPDTTFYGTAGKKLESKIKTVSDFIGDAEKMYDESKIANVMTDLITSYQTQAAGFTPEYAGDILSKTGEEGFFGAIKSAEASRRGKLIDEYKDLWNRPKVGAEGGRASAVSPEAFAKAFGTTWAEFGTERTAELLPGLFKAIKGKMPKEAQDAIGRLMIGNWLKKIGFEKAAALLYMGENRLALNGLLGEMFEEIVNQPLSNIIMGDDVFEGMDQRFFEELGESL